MSHSHLHLESYTTVTRRDGYVKPRCSCCQVLVINGIACHETGCPQKG